MTSGSLDAHIEPDMFDHLKLAEPKGWFGTINRQGN